jgi:hypothetical protein
VVRTGVSLLNLFGLVEQKWTDFVSFGSSKKSKTVVPSSKMASGGGGGGGSSTQPPGGEEGKNSKKERKIDTHESQRAFIEQKKKSGEWEKCNEWKDSYQNKSGYRFTPTVEKWEFEVYKKISGKWTHIGIIRPGGEKILTEFAKGIIRK